MKIPALKDLILFENDDFIIVNKPPFISTLDDRHDPTNMLQLVRGYCESATASHRLDKETSGALAFSKHAEAYRHLSIQFEKRTVEKLYWAICDGIHDFQNTRVDAPLHITAKGYVKIHRGKGKPSQTTFGTLETFKYHSLVQCQPETGRMHQIRVHLSSLAAPISGDEMYGGKPIFLSQLKPKFTIGRGKEEQAMMRRVALHAHQLTFKGIQGEEISIEAPLPKDMEVCLKKLRQFSH